MISTICIVYFIIELTCKASRVVSKAKRSSWLTAEASSKIRALISATIFSFPATAGFFGVAVTAGSSVFPFVFFKAFFLQMGNGLFNS